VVGVGAFGRHHARIYGELARERVRLVGLVDIDPEGPRPVADRLGVPLVRDVSHLPEPVDLVSVAVPTTSHRRIAEPLLKQGVHCLVEKPIAGSTRDARALVDAALASGACLQVGLIERFNPVLDAITRLGEPPLYIEAHRLSPFSPRNLDVGVVMDLMIHDLDILNHLVGERAETVSAVGVAMTGAHEDIANARITFPSGCVANLTASRVSEQRTRAIRIFTRKGYLCLDYDKREAQLVRPARRLREWSARVADLAARPAHVGEDPGPGAPPPFGELMRVERLSIGAGEPLKSELESAVRVVRGEARPRVGGLDGLAALEVAERILTRVRGGAAAPPPEARPAASEAGPGARPLP
jgi:predicted dehydrogenase